MSGLELIVGLRDLPDWIGSHRGQLEEILRESGGALFRRCGVSSTVAFERVLSAVDHEHRRFSEESSPRHKVSERVFTATDYPNRYPIQFHNENSYAYEWPRHLLFHCSSAASTGGQTLLADTRSVLSRIPDSTLAEFTRRGVLYERRYAPNLGVPWTTAFATPDRASVDAYCSRAGISCEWDGDVLRTRQTANAVIVHPGTGEVVWFNHVLLFNVLGLEPAWLRQFIANEPPTARSTNSYFGDGEEIPASDLDAVRDAYQAETIRFDWERGDVLLIDNMLLAHGRAAYEGDRKVYVAMAGRVTRSEVEAVSTWPRARPLVVG